MAQAIVVFGATGTHGGAVARALLTAGVQVYAFVRDPGSEKAQALMRKGAQLQVGDLDDPASIVRALEGKGACYAVTTPFEGGSQQEVRQGENMIAAAQKAGLSWFIFASVASARGADVPHFKSKAQIERALEQTGLAWTIVAPSYFYENVLSLSAAIEAGTLPLALAATTRLQQVALADLGALVATIVSREAEHLGKRIEVAADQPTPMQMAEALGLRFEERPIDDLAERNPDLGAMYRFLSEQGYSVDIERVKRSYPEVPWRSFAGWARGLDRRRD
jgi:uncharacterized protein YbjT (DUF2867 family)